MIKESTLEFLKNLEENNTKEWFEMNRKWYETSKSNFVDFCSLILNEMKQFEPDFSNTNVKDCIFRINRDIRFSKDKSPYKNHLSAAFGSITKWKNFHRGWYVAAFCCKSGKV